VWTPPAGAVPFGSFINKEHYAAWIVMLLPLAAGYTLAMLRESVRAPQPGSKPGRWTLGVIGTGKRLLVTAGVAVMAVSLLLTGSRAGAAALAIGLAVATADGWRRGRRGQTRVFAAVVGAVVVAVAVWAAVGLSDRGAGRLSAGRWPAWQDTARIIADFPIAGTGLGTYAKAMPVYQSHDRDVMFAETHNDYLQLVAEGGALVTVPAIVLAVVLALTIRRRMAAGEDDPMTRGIRLGAVGGLAGIAAFEFVQFGLQLPGNAICFVVLLALALHRPRRRLAHAHRI
jgi:O-antigen ligase